MFIATGQDVANVAESHAGITYAQLLDNGDYYWSITLPSLIVAHLRRRHRPGHAARVPGDARLLRHGQGATSFAEICAAVVLAGEISLRARFSPATGYRATTASAATGPDTTWRVVRRRRLGCEHLLQDIEHLLKNGLVRSARGAWQAARTSTGNGIGSRRHGRMGPGTGTQSGTGKDGCPSSAGRQHTNGCNR